METKSLNEAGLTNTNNLSADSLKVNRTQNNYLPLIIGGISIILLLSVAVIVLAISLVNMASENGKPLNNDNSITGTASASPNTTQALKVGGTQQVTPTVNVTSNNFESIAFNYQFDYPQDWTLIEAQAYPMGPGPKTGEDLYINSADNKMSFQLEINPKPWDGTESTDTLLINNKYVPFGVLPGNGYVTYYFNGSPDILGVNIQDCSRISVSLRIDNSVQLDAAKAILVDIVSSIRSK